LSSNLSKKEDPKDLNLSSDEASQLAQQLKVQLMKGELKKVELEKINLIIAGLGDKRGLIRRTFAESLGNIGKAALPGLFNALKKSENVIVRRAAAKTLKLVGEPTALPHLLEALLNDEDPVVQGSSAGAMAIFGEEAIEHLVAVLKNPFSTAMQCGLATWAMAFIGKNAPNGLKKAAQSNNPVIRIAGIAALEDLILSLNDNEAKMLLLEALEDPISDVRIEATRLIININDINQVEKLLLQKLNDNELLVRKNAALSLMKIKSINSISHLKERIKLESDISMINTLKLAIKLISN
tara:strand:+ start:3751 stop:4641 length:891 start_codon:yes stop_codon:yes gene_type:complete